MCIRDRATPSQLEPAGGVEPPTCRFERVYQALSAYVGRKWLLAGIMPLSPVRFVWPCRPVSGGFGAGREYVRSTTNGDGSSRPGQIEGPRADELGGLRGERSGHYSATPSSEGTRRRAGSFCLSAMEAHHRPQLLQHVSELCREGRVQRRGDGRALHGDQARRCEPVTAELGADRHGREDGGGHVVDRGVLGPRPGRTRGRRRTPTAERTRSVHRSRSVRPTVRRCRRTVLRRW